MGQRWWRLALVLRDVEEEDGGVGHVGVHHGEDEEEEEEAVLKGEDSNFERVRWRECSENILGGQINNIP